MTTHNPWQDNQFQTWTIEKVEELEDCYVMTVDECWGLGLKKHYGITPHAGDTVTCWGEGLGFDVRGVAVNGQVAFYKTREHQEWVAEAKRKEKEHFELEGRAKLDARFSELPLPFQERILRFRANKADFRWGDEEYEMLACMDGAKIAAYLGTSQAIEEFRKMPHEQQKATVPTLYQGHSGNTWGCAIRLAYHMVTDPVLVWADHAAISALTGCEEAGCPPVSKEELEAKRQWFAERGYAKNPEGQVAQATSVPAHRCSGDARTTFWIADK